MPRTHFFIQPVYNNDDDDEDDDDDDEIDEYSLLQFESFSISQSTNLNAKCMWSFGQKWFFGFLFNRLENFPSTTII